MVPPEVGSSPETIWLEVKGLRIHCLSAGTRGSPVLLLHGGGIDSASFSYKYAIRPLASEHQVFAPDWPGYGRSDKPDIEYTMEFYLNFLEQLMNTLRLNHASLVGLSLGGGAALGFALRSPERVEKLVLVDSYGLGDEAPLGRLGYLLIRAPLINDLSYALLRRSHRMVRWSLYNLVHDRQVVNEDMVEETYRLLDQNQAGRAFRSFQKNEVGWSGLRTDFAGRLHEISTPTLIVHGADDSVVPVEWARRAHERLASSELLVFPNCGHLLPRERPEEFNRAVGRFLGS